MMECDGNLVINVESEKIVLNSPDNGWKLY